ncbi:MAG TPA: hypothetical protein VNZ45_05130 [Bacteroidia bacterium]|jgi:hypothetical protein|nr:hypothetical protein [Bacteroidia bacterium]
MIGNKMGKWLVLREVKVPQARTARFKHFECQCECGTIKTVRADGLRNGRSSQCRECSEKERFIDTESYIGKQFGKLKVISVAENHKNGQRRLLCECECGEQKIITASRLKIRKPQSCHLCNVVKHGYENTPTYDTWRCMRARCTRETNDNYMNYGGRGIKVCDRWNDFNNFLEDMGERPPGLQLDRIDNDGNYEPGNCRWVTPKENSNNRTRKS